MLLISYNQIPWTYALFLYILNVCYAFFKPSSSLRRQRLFQFVDVECQTAYTRHITPATVNLAINTRLMARQQITTTTLWTHFDQCVFNGFNVLHMCACGRFLCISVFVFCFVLLVLSEMWCAHSANAHMRNNLIRLIEIYGWPRGSVGFWFAHATNAWTLGDAGESARLSRRACAKLGKVSAIF